MTDSERRLWSCLRGKQILGVQFYRQRPLGPYIVDFYAAKVRLVIEVDGGQHFQQRGIEKDSARDRYLNQMELDVLRFDNRQVLLETEAVVRLIYDTVAAKLAESPPGPPL